MTTAWTRSVNGIEVLSFRGKQGLRYNSTKPGQQRIFSCHKSLPSSCARRPANNPDPRHLPIPTLRTAVAGLLRPFIGVRKSRAFYGFDCFISLCGYHVKMISLNRAAAAVLTLSALTLAGCGTPAPKDFGGSWKSVNRFQSTPTEIPLERPYTYFASPMDGTLKTMLTRWSKDAGVTLVYQLPSDYTLYTPVTKIHTLNVHEAAAELNSIYAAEGVFVTATDRQIVVEQASAITPEKAETKEASDASKTPPSTGSKK
jgi:hypothetical protein